MSNVGLAVSANNFLTYYVDGSPFTSFSQSFYINDAHWYSILEIEVLTGYESYAASASVVIDNTTVGTIEPRPVSRYQDLQSYSLLFGNGALSGGSPYTGLHKLTIKPKTQFDWLIAGRWRIFYQRP
jgi:hypothetical protein